MPGSPVESQLEPASPAGRARACRHSRQAGKYRKLTSKQLQAESDSRGQCNGRPGHGIPESQESRIPESPGSPGSEKKKKLGRRALLKPNVQTRSALLIITYVFNVNNYE